MRLYRSELARDWRARGPVENAARFSTCVGVALRMRSPASRLPQGRVLARVLVQERACSRSACTRSGGKRCAVFHPTRVLRSSNAIAGKPAPQGRVLARALVQARACSRLACTWSGGKRCAVFHPTRVLRSSNAIAGKPAATGERVGAGACVGSGLLAIGVHGVRWKTLRGFPPNAGVASVECDRRQAGCYRGACWRGRLCRIGLARDWRAWGPVENAARFSTLRGCCVRRMRSPASRLLQGRVLARALV